MKRWLIAMGVVVCAGVTGGMVWWRWQTPDGPNYRTVALERGSLVQTVKATGTVNPIRLVEVGTQVNGPIQKLYVDFNDQVKAGDLVAQIDPTVYKAQLAQQQANLLKSEASVDDARARLEQAEKSLVRARELARRDMISAADLDAAVSDRDTLAAQLKVAQASVEQSKAALQLAEANLSYTVIRSPVDGVVIDRSVSEGQTVVASMTAKTLFNIATDLREVEIQASMPEADIGYVKEGQTVVFTVDAYDDSFTGRVTQIRLAAKTSQNVVTYPVIVRAKNPEGKLFPGMTANISCEVARREDVLKVPNAALRFKMVSATPAAPAMPPAGTRGRRGGKSQVWVVRESGKAAEAVVLKTGITDGTQTEIKEASGLDAGDLVVVGTNGTAGASAEVVNPFVPKMPARRGMR